MNTDFDIIIIGAGAVGLAISSILSKSYNICLIEKESKFGMGISSRNSEVIHSGIYYPENSLKAKLCTRGNILLYEYLREKNIDYNRVGKIVVSLEKSDEELLESYYIQAQKNGAKVEKISKSKINKMEPIINAESAFFSPNTGIFNSHKFMSALEIDTINNGGTIVYNSEVISLKKHSMGWQVTLKEYDNTNTTINTQYVINSTGLASDLIVEKAGIDLDTNGYKLTYCKGSYFKLSSKYHNVINHHIYPVPSHKSGLLGIHVTLGLDNNVKLGPDIEYLENRIENYKVDEKLQSLFFFEASKFIKHLSINDLKPDTSGIRPRLKNSKQMFSDFIIEEVEGYKGLLNLIAIDSPGLTSSLAIAEYIIKGKI